MQTPGSNRWLRGWLTAVVAAILLTSAGCGSGSSKGPAAGNDPLESPDPAQSASAEAAADASACQAVQDTFIHLASVSAGWNRTTDPFNRTMAEAIFPTAEQLRSEARSAGTTKMKVVIERNADALDALSTAMIAQQKPQFHAALARTQHAYAALPACAHRDGSPTPVKGGPTSGGSATPTAPAAPSQQATPLQQKYAKDPGCIRAKAAYTTVLAATSGWNVGSDPFDAENAGAFRTASNALDAAARSAKAQAVRTALQDDAQAFQRLTTAMGARDRSGVDNGVVGVQQLTRTLAAICPLT